MGSRGCVLKSSDCLVNQYQSEFSTCYTSYQSDIASGQWHSFHHDASILHHSGSQKYGIYRFRIRVILWTVPPFLGTEKYLYNYMTSGFMIRFGPRCHYLKASEADSRFGIDFRCWIGIWQLLTQAITMKSSKISVQVIEAIIRPREQIFCYWRQKDPHTSSNWRWPQLRPGKKLAVKKLRI